VLLLMVELVMFAVPPMSINAAAAYGLVIVDGRAPNAQVAAIVNAAAKSTSVVSNGYVGQTQTGALRQMPPPSPEHGDLMNNG
jgi:predicted membrane-bound mannosyltransferase